MRGSGDLAAEVVDVRHRTAPQTPHLERGNAAVLHPPVDGALRDLKLLRYLLQRDDSGTPHGRSPICIVSTGRASSERRNRQKRLEPTP